MKPSRCFALGLSLAALLATAAVAAMQRGIPARRSVADYAVQGRLDGVAVGARLLTAREVRARFVTEVSRCYLVVEAGLFPAPGKLTSVAPADFTLVSLSTHKVFTPESPQVVAYAVSKSQASETRVTVYPTVGVGYGTGGGPWGYPGYPGYLGYPAPGGVYTSVGVGVGIGSAGEPSSADPATMQTELTDKSLPKGTFSSPGAGSFYFRVPPHQGPFQLRYRLGRKTLSLRLP
jgi:hypothetical protein